MINYINGLRECGNELLWQASTLNTIALMLKVAYDNGNMIYIMGNGGSATTASHFTRDLKIGAKGKYKCLVECLTDNIAVVTSLANDVSYGEIFSEQLDGQVSKDDLVIAISCSGNSENILKGLAIARKASAKTIGILGFGGGKMIAMCDKWIVLKNNNYGQCEDMHSAVCHIITNILKEKIGNE